MTAKLPEGQVPKALEPYIDKMGKVGLPCPRCGGGTMVMDSRPDVLNTIKRRRSCIASACLHRFSTREISGENLEALIEAVDGPLRLLAQMLGAMRKTPL